MLFKTILISVWIPVLHPDTAILAKLVTVHAVGLSGRQHPPETNGSTSSTGLSQSSSTNGTEKLATSVSCPVTLTTGWQPAGRVTYNMNGQSCVVTNYNIFIYKGLSGSVTTPNFSFTSPFPSTVGHIITIPIQVFQNTQPTANNDTDGNCNCPHKSGLLSAVPQGPNYTTRLEKNCYAWI